MFGIEKIQEVIAERHFYVEGKPGISVRVVIGVPQRASSSPDNQWMLCPYQIIGIGDERVKCAAGVDAFQAIQLVMEMIGADLHFRVSKECGGRLRWEGGKNGDLGFPVPAGLEDEK